MLIIHIKTHRHMHRIFGQNQVTFELDRDCLLNDKVYSRGTLIHSYVYLTSTATF